MNDRLTQETLSKLRVHMDEREALQISMRTAERELKILFVVMMVKLGTIAGLILGLVYILGRS